MLRFIASRCPLSRYSNFSVAAWIANGRQLEGLDLRLREGLPRDLSIVELMAAYLKHAKREYSRSNETEVIVDALKPLKKLYGSMAAAEFSPKKLKNVREGMI